MVREIIEITAELQAKALGELTSFMDRQINVHHMRPVCDISWRVAKYADAGINEHRGVEDR